MHSKLKFILILLTVITAFYIYSFISINTSDENTSENDSLSDSLSDSSISKNSTWKNEAIMFHLTHDGAISKDIKNEFSELSRKILSGEGIVNRTHETLKSLVFVTYNSDYSPCLLEKQFYVYRFPYYAVVGKEFNGKWTWWGKILPLLNFLRDVPPHIQYVVASDCNDVVIAKDIDGIIDLFEEYQCDLLFCNTHHDWPPNENHNLFEQKCYNASKYHNHLSAGIYIGRTKAILYYLQWIVDNLGNMQGHFDDQATWRELHYQHYPKIKVDYLCKIFSRFDDYINEF